MAVMSSVIIGSESISGFRRLAEFVNFDIQKETKEKEKKKKEKEGEGKRKEEWIWDCAYVKTAEIG